MSWGKAEEDALRREVSNCYSDPLRYVLLMYPWGSPKLPVEGPRKWQAEYLRGLGKDVAERRFTGKDAVTPIRYSTVSGHGVGKTALAAWLINWLHDTRPHSKGSVTANTATQLAGRTWAEVGKWRDLGLTKHWSSFSKGTGNMRMTNRSSENTWFVQAFTSRRENAEAFQGQHAEGSTSFYIFDEASGIPREIYEAAYGGLARGEPHFHEFGNGTQSGGEFHSHHHRMRKMWVRRQIDASEVEGANKALIDEWVKAYGWDSDFVKVRVRGEFPSLGTLQYIPSDWVDECMALDPVHDITDPLIFGIDVAREGDDSSVIWPRRGRAATGEPDKIDVLDTPDTTVLARHVVERFNTESPDAMFIDGGGVGGPVADMIRSLGVKVIEVNGAMKSPDRRFANMRSYMWGQMREAIRLRAIALPRDEELREDLTSVQYGYRMTDNALILEAKKDMKARGVASPDRGDALGLTYAFPVPHRATRLEESWHIEQRPGQRGGDRRRSHNTRPQNLYTDHDLMGFDE